jgi:hypothetical protein
MSRQETSSLARGEKRPHNQIDCEDLVNDVQLAVTTGAGVTTKIAMAATATILALKESIEQESGVPVGDMRLFHQQHQEELNNEQIVGVLRLEEDSEHIVEINMMIEQADAQQLVPLLGAGADVKLGECTDDTNDEEGDEELDYTLGVAFIPSHPDWIATTEYLGCRLKVTNIKTRSLVCKFGERGDGSGEFDGSWGVAVTADSLFVLVADADNHRVQVLRLTVGNDPTKACLDFVRFIGNGSGSKASHLRRPIGVTLLPGSGRQETVLVTDEITHTVVQYSLEGEFIRVFAGTGAPGREAGDFNSPWGITALLQGKEVAVADSNNHRIQIFDSEGNYKRECGVQGKAADGAFFNPAGLASDAHGNLLVTDVTNRLQVFSPEGKHLCTRNDLGLSMRGYVCICTR